VLVQTRSTIQGAPFHPVGDHRAEVSEGDFNHSSSIFEEIEETTEATWEHLQNASEAAAASVSNAATAVYDSAGNAVSGVSEAIRALVHGALYGSAANQTWDLFHSTWSSLANRSQSDMTPEFSKTCTTQKTAYGFTWRSEVAEEGSHCWFGVDGRDEGYHCIDLAGDLGVNGWCWTSKTANTWGKCAEGCPLAGSDKVLAEKLDSLHEKVEEIAHSLESSR